MGRIFCLMGKSASGKDSIYRRITEKHPEIGSYVMYTTRSMREGEHDGVSYHFITDDEFKRLSASGRVIESRSYNTVYGPWIYATVDDGSIDISRRDYLIPATLESYLGLRSYYGEDKTVPVYIELDDGERLLRAVRREMKEDTPKYKELCRRFIADCEDFSEDRLKAAGVTRRFYNDDLDSCADEITAFIASFRQ